MTGEFEPPPSGLTPDEAAIRLEELGFVNPQASAALTFKRAPSLLSLAGKRGGLLDNRKGNGNLLLEDLAAILVRDYDVESFVSAEKWIYSRPAPGELIDDLARQVDFVVTAVGD